MSAAPGRPTPNVDTVPPVPFSPVADPPFNDAVRQPTTHGADRLVGLAASRLKAAAVASAPLRRRSDDRYGVRDDDYDEDYGEPGRRRWPIVTGVLVLLVILLGAGVYGAWSYNQRQYYVGVHDGYVSIFRGTNQSVAGIGLSSLLVPSTLKVSQLGASDQGTISQTSSEGSLTGAQAGVNQLQLGEDKCHAQWIALATWQAQSIRYQSELATAAASKPKIKVSPSANPGPMPAVPDTASCAPASAFGIPASALPA
jgi:hypothetical protein